MAAWPKDFATDLPMIPPAEFTTFKEYPGSTQPARIRKLPVLRGWFDSKQFEVNPKLPAHIGWGSVNIGASMALTLRIQLGPNTLYWLANPGDPHVWAVLDKWAAAGQMVLAAEFGDAPPLIIGRDFNLRHPSYGALRKLVSDTSQTANFIVDASRVIAAGDIKLIANSDIALYSKLQYVQACMVRTEVTQGVAVMVNEGAPGPNGAVADAVEALIKGMLRPDQGRH